jgi:hypothetical protein
VKAIDLLQPSPLYLEIGQESVRMLDGESLSQLALERDGTARLTAASVEQLTAHFNQVVRRSIFGRRRAFCAIGARGVSLRRLVVPPNVENPHQFLTLQMEREFPLAPEALAWGICENEASVPSAVRSERQPSAQTAARTVVAVKRDLIVEYSQILSGCGLDAVFTLGILAVRALIPNPPHAYAVLAIHPHHSELLVVEQGIPVALRILSFGAAKDAPAHPDNSGSKPLEAVPPEIATVVGAIRTVWKGEILYLAGDAARQDLLADVLARALGDGSICKRIPASPDHSATLLGLKTWWENGQRNPPLVLQINRTTRAMTRTAQYAQWKWAAAAGVLLVCLFVLRYAEPFLKGPGLSKRLAEIQAQTTSNPEIDSELLFLQFMETNRPPYLDVLASIGDAAAPGTRVEALTMNRRGEISFRGAMQSSQEAIHLRARLIESGLFSRVVLEEQTPTQDNRVQVRITARWLPARDRAPSASKESPGKGDFTEPNS